MNEKRCVDCKYYRPFTTGVWIFRINHPSLEKCAQELEPVRGEPSEFCEFKRKPTGSCGPDGKLWEAKEPLGRAEQSHR